LASFSLAVKLLEFDKRFAAYGDDFVFYDYNSPLQFNQVPVLPKVTNICNVHNLHFICFEKML
jgi:hypothetical protein